MTPQDFNKAIVTISKDELATLPIAEYPGKIYLIDDLIDADRAIQSLKKVKIIGFDTETRPSFKKGQSFNVALIQLATPDCCYLFRTSEIGFPDQLMKLLENPDILKVGLSIRDDFHNLKKVTDFEPQSFIDLQQFVKDYKIADNSLSRLYGILFGERISKGQRLTNWAAQELTDMQQSYAALDAYACIRIYDYLKNDRFDPSTSPYLTVPPEPVVENCDEN